MTDVRDVHPAEITSGRREAGPDGQHPAHEDHDASQRARYLAKAASLGQVVFDDDPLVAEH